MTIRVTTRDVYGSADRYTAVCNYCQRPASQLCMSQSNIGETNYGKEAPDGIVMDARTQKTELTIIYTCDKCYDRAADELLERYGYASNVYKSDQLAQAVNDHFFSIFVPVEDEVTALRIGGGE